MTKTIHLFGIALSCSLMAAEPPNPDAQPLKRVTKINPANALKQLKDMEANEACIDSILKNENTKTTMDKLKAPVVLHSMEDALKHLTRASMENIDLNFETHKLVIFAWQGSGQDRLSSRLSRHNRATAIINYKPGRTEDLRTHSVIYSMRKDMQIKVFEEPEIIHCDGLMQKNEAQPRQNGIQGRVQPQKKEP